MANNTQIAVGDCYEVVVRALLNGNAHNNVWHFQCVAAHSTIETQLLAALIACYSALIPVLSTGFVLQQVTYQKIDDAVGPLWEYTIPGGTNLQGASASEGMASFVSACISIPTLKPGRGRTGRKYIGGVPESGAAVDSFKLDDPFWAAIVAFVACVVSKFVFSTDPAVPAGKFWQVGIASREIGATRVMVNGEEKLRKPYTGNFFFPAQNMTVKKEIKSMVSRKAGRGQ